MAHTAVVAAVFPLLMTIYALYEEDSHPTRFGKGLFIGMAFTAGAGSEAQRGTMRLKGVADFAVLEFPLAGSTSLEKWSLTWRGEDEPATLAAEKPQTLDELRALLRNQ